MVPEPERQPFAWRGVGAVCVVLAAVLGVTINAYGYHRDELYFRMLGAHPAWSYVDEPPLTPLLVHASTAIFGDSLWALRLPAIICGVLTVVIVALMCRELGGGTVAQVIAAIGACASFALASGHSMFTASPDMVFWTLTILFIVRALMRDDPRWWIAAGVTIGAALYNKQLIALLVIGLAVGLLISGPRRAFRSPYLWIGALLALVIASPTIVWQVTHHFPEVTMSRAIARDKGSNDRITFIPFQIVLVAPIWIAGLVAMFRREQWRPIRALAWAYPVVAVIVIVTGGQIYYTYGLLTLYFAVACAGITRVRPRLVIGMAVFTAVWLAIALPIIPVGSLGKTPIPAVNSSVGDAVGWPAYVREVAAAYHGLASTDRAGTVIITANYGEAGAIDKFGDAYGLPAVYSGHNQLWYYGPPSGSATSVLLVGFDEGDSAEHDFASCTRVGKLDDNVGVDNQEQGEPIFFCTTPTASWSQLWPSFQHYG